MLAIDQGLSVVALDHAMRGGHLHRFIVSDIALDLFAMLPILGSSSCEKLVQAFDCCNWKRCSLFLSAAPVSELRLLVVPGHVRAITCCSFACSLSRFF